jgi:SAM-dependent methyltransferase
MSKVRDWISFWNDSNSVYVNERHFEVHYRDIAEGIAALLPGPNARVLDYGSGRASHADLVAARAGKLYLCDAAENVRADLTRRFGGNARIAVMAPETVTRMDDRSLDMIVANSLLQYISTDELGRLLALWRALLAPAGILVVGDVIPPVVGPFTDILALLRYAAQNGFFLAALAGLARTVTSDYRAVRSRQGIATYSESEFVQKLAAAGFLAERLARNLEHNQARMTFIARPR